MSPTSEISEKSEMHQKYLFSPSPCPPDQFLNIFCLLHIHPQLLHLIRNSHISPPSTHPKTINFVKLHFNFKVGFTENHRRISVIFGGSSHVQDVMVTKSHDILVYFFRHDTCIKQKGQVKLNDFTIN